jgi:hypothetical protein
MKPELKRFSFLVFPAALCACASPEATRTQGGGPGADVGNKKEIVRMHEGARPFDKTPKIIDAEHPPLETAYQADELSRR